jgi:hypothetical protein
VLPSCPSCVLEMLGVEGGKYFQNKKKRGKQGMRLRHGFELAQIACRESRISEYPRASVGAIATWLAHRTIPFFCRQNGIATTRVFGKTPVPPRFFTLDDILLGREH